MILFRIQCGTTEAMGSSMRVQMWCDMEGVAGITRWGQVDAGSPGYEEGRQLYTNEINAAVRGAKRAGATEIIVVDGHGAGGDYSFNSLLKTQLEPGAEYVFGHRWGCYVDALQAGCDAMLLPGAHAMAGSPRGGMSHTMSNQSWYNLRVNGRLVGESGIVAAIAGHFGTPVVFVSGDDETVAEVKALVGDTCVGAAVKTALTRYSARHLAPSDACALIETRVEEALRNRAAWPAPYKSGEPAVIEVELHTPDKVELYRNRKGVEITGPRSVRATAPTVWECWQNFWHG